MINYIKRHTTLVYIFLPILLLVGCWTRKKGSTIKNPTLTDNRQLQVGDQAPLFKSTDQTGAPIALENFRGKKVILYFYPKGNTPMCTIQARNLRDNYEHLVKKGFVVLGISKDKTSSHQQFAKKNQLPFLLVSDEDGAIQKKYGVWVRKNIFLIPYWGTARTTFVIDEQGKIKKIIDKISPTKHTAQILQHENMDL